MEMTPDRIKYHEMIEKFKALLTEGANIYDVGKSHIHDYTSTFKGFGYITLDRDPFKKPDILIDVEIESDIEQADALLLNGVTEQCDNPYTLFRNINKILKMGGLALFGIISIGRPTFDNDRVRFTPNGARLITQLYGFEIIEELINGDPKSPSYIFMIARKTKETA